MTQSPNALAEWSAESVRLTLFPVVQLQGMDMVTRIWRGVAGGQEPDEATSKASTATHIVHGPLAAGRLIVAAQPGRVDIQLALEPAVSPVMAKLGSAEEVLADFLARVGPLMKDVPALHRMAFGAVLLQSTESRPAGYRALERFLPTLKIEPENSSDLSYQINRPRPSTSGVEGLQINRLMKWSVQSLNMVQMHMQMHMQMHGTSPVPSSNVSTSPLTYAARLEVDISTAVTGRALPATALPNLLDEHIALAREIAEKGDVP